MGDAKMSEVETISEILNMRFEDKGMEKDSWESGVEGNRQAVKSRAEELMRENRRLMGGHCLESTAVGYWHETDAIARLSEYS